MTGFYIMYLDFSGINSVQETCILGPIHLYLGMNFSLTFVN